MVFVLDGTNKSLKFTITAGAGSDVHFTSHWADATTSGLTEGQTQGTSNGSTTVDAVASPAASTRRVVKLITFHNTNTTLSRTVTLVNDVGGTSRTIAVFTLAPLATWYSDTAATTAIADGDKGDITVSGSGATWTIDNDAITTAKILDANVTLAKIANITSGNLLGRTSGGSGPVQEITPGTGVLTWLQTPTSANLAAAVTDETGSGALVFATSPTLVTPTLGAASATSIAFNAGSASAPSITLTGDTNTGIFSPAADKLSVTTNGTVIGTFLGAAEGTGTGNLLVGDFTTHPVSAASGRGLTIMQDGLSELQFISYSSVCVIRSWVPNGTISAPTATTSSRSAVFGINGHTGTSYLLAASAAVLLQSTENFTSSAHGTSISLETTENGTTSRLSRVFIANDGKVGIATSSPTARLDIDSDKIRLRTSKTITYGQTAGGNNIDAGDVGDICWDANYIYVRVSDSNWRRVATSTW